MKDTEMKSEFSRVMKPVVALLVLLGVVALTAAPGCNTLEGAGEDIESGGEAVQDAAD